MITCPVETNTDLGTLNVSRWFCFLSHEDALDSHVDPYAEPSKRKVGPLRPKISHLPAAIDARTRQERQAEKQAVAKERRAIKKSARRHLKQQLVMELDDVESDR